MKKAYTRAAALLLAASLSGCAAAPQTAAESTDAPASAEAPDTPGASEAPTAETEAAVSAPAPKEIKRSDAGNPFTGFDGEGVLTYGGDPSALVSGDTLYLYVGHDTAVKDEYVIPEYLCYSTKDMKSWSYEGVTLRMSEVSWADRNSAWAAQFAEHYDSALGKNMYYMYFCSWDSTDSGKQSIGVAVSDSPTGPFTDIGAPIVRGSLTSDETSAWNDIDPTVWIENDENGEEHRYLAWGNSKLYMCELNEDMISVKDRDGDGEIKFKTDIKSKMTPDLYTEAPWIYRRKDDNGNYYGDYYLFYAYGWREQMAYATAGDLMDGKFAYQDTIMDASATSNTNHMAVVDFLGKTWFIYHNGALPRGSGFRRSVCAEEVEFYKDGAVKQISETSSGAFGTCCELVSLGGDTLAHKRFGNSTSDSAYPYTDIELGSGFEKSDENDARWLIAAGKADPGDKYTVSLVSENKPGLYITEKDGGLVLCQDYDGKKAAEQSFRTTEGLSGSGVSFESVSKPGTYITLSGGRASLTDGSDADAASFEITEILSGE